MELFPNPATEKTNLTLLNNKAIHQAHIALYDVTGRMVSLIYKGALSQGKQEFEIIHPTNASFGVYYIKVNTNEGSASQRLIFENE